MNGRDIPEEMVEKAARELYGGPHHRTKVVGGDIVEYTVTWDEAEEPGPYGRAVYRGQARRVLSAALAGRQVVELPEPDEKLDDQDAPQWNVDGVDGAVESHPETAEVDFAYWTWPVATARAFAAAVLAAAEIAAGSGVGDQP